jgi:hypothetical protein
MADSKSGEARVRPVMDTSCASMRASLSLTECLHLVSLRVWAPHCRPSMWRLLLRSASVHGGWLVVVTSGADLVFVVDVAFTAGVDIGCDKA